MCATRFIISMEAPATSSGAWPRPRGVSAAPRANPGIIRKEDIGATTRLEISPQVATLLKCWMANGPVASPATKLTAMLASVQVTAACARRIGQGTSISRTGRGQASARATRAAVAAKDIWNPGSVTASGCNSRTAMAARARACRLIAWRSTRIAQKATPAVIAARSAGGGAPESTRYPLTAANPRTAATFLPGTRNASHGTAATAKRNAPNTRPMTIAMCKPETDSKCASPESRIAAISIAGMALWVPLRSAAATAPAAPGIVAATWASSQARNPARGGTGPGFPDNNSA